MNYELAKELKDAGFSYRKDLHFALKPDNTRRTVGDKEEGEYVYEPTLSELIEACGEHFEVLKHEKDGWRATWHDKVTEVNGYGQTPVEAAARLWLILNKK